MSTALLEGASSFRAEWRCLVVFLLKAVWVAVRVWEIIDAAPFASVAVFFSGNEVRDLFWGDFVEPGFALSWDDDDCELLHCQ